MPKLPEQRNLNANSVEIMNAIRKDAGEYYQSIVPRAEGDTASIRAVGQAIMGNPTTQNAFLSALVNRIGRVIITNRMYSNPWAMFKKGLLEFGETVEEIFVNIADPQKYDPELAEEEVFKRVIPDVRAVFHPMNYQEFYKTTVSNDQLRQAFLSWSGITDLIAKIIDALYTGANYDELVTMKYLVARNILTNGLYNQSIPAVNKTNASDIVSTIKGISNDMEFLKDEYNFAKVLTTSTKDRQYLIMNSKFDAVIDVEVLATSFNMSKAEFMGNRVLIDSFSLSSAEQTRLAKLFKDDANFVPISTSDNQLLATVPCILIDRDWFMVFDNFENMTEQYNGQGLYWNYWYHVWKTFSTSPFANGVMFSTTASTITGVNVTPPTATLSPGAQMRITSEVTGTGFVDQRVEYTLNTSASTITPDGLLTVGADESTSSIVVTVTSKADPTKTGTSTITIV